MAQGAKGRAAPQDADKGYWQERARQGREAAARAGQEAQQATRLEGAAAQLRTAARADDEAASAAPRRRLRA